MGLFGWLKGLFSGGLLRGQAAGGAPSLPAGLPPLRRPADLAKALGTSPGRLRWLAPSRDGLLSRHYVTFPIPKRSGGTREISAPLPHLAAAQRWILANLLEKLPPGPGAHGFVKGRSTVTNAQPHVGQAVLVNLDVRDFFPSITLPRVRGLFRKMGYPEEVAGLLSRLTTKPPSGGGKPSLPQGACTSPAISNLVARRLDRRLRGMAAASGWRYTRYADDLTFSAAGESRGGGVRSGNVAWLLARARHILREEGFEVNEGKTRVRRRNARQEVTGIVVNRKLSVPRRERRRLRAVLFRLEREEGVPSNILRGHLAYVRMVNPEQCSKLIG